MGPTAWNKKQLRNALHCLYGTYRTRLDWKQLRLHTQQLISPDVHCIGRHLAERFPRVHYFSIMAAEQFLYHLRGIKWDTSPTTPFTTAPRWCVTLIWRTSTVVTDTFISSFISILSPIWREKNDWNTTQSPFSLPNVGTNYPRCWTRSNSSPDAEGVQEQERSYSSSVSLRWVGNLLLTFFN